MNIEITPRGTIREQVASYFRGQIRQGILPPGSRIPPAREIARNLNVAEANVQHAMALLAKEGLIARRRHTGSVVLKPHSTLRGVALFVPWKCLERGEEYTRLLSVAITRELANREISTQIIYDSPDGMGRQHLKELIADGKIQGVIFRFLDDENLEFANSLGVFYSGNSPLSLPGCFRLFTDRLANRLITEIDKSGIKSLGVISNEADKRNSVASHWNKFYKKLEKRHIEVREEWIYDALKYHHSKGFLDSTKFGWNAVEYFSALPERPQGFLLFSDDLVYGVAMAFYHHHIKVPEDYRIFVHHTRENPVLFPFSCTLVQQSIEEIARQMVQNLVDFNHGRVPQKPELTIWTKNIK